MCVLINMYSILKVYICTAIKSDIVCQTEQHIPFSSPSSEEDIVRLVSITLNNRKQESLRLYVDGVRWWSGNSRCDLFSCGWLSIELEYWWIWLFAIGQRENGEMENTFLEYYVISMQIKIFGKSEMYSIV